MNIKLHSTNGFETTSINTIIGDINLPENILEQIVKGRLTLQLYPTINLSTEKVIEFRIGYKKATPKT